jgi:hypothetical protein
MRLFGPGFTDVLARDEPEKDRPTPPGQIGEGGFVSAGVPTRLPSAPRTDGRSWKTIGYDDDAIRVWDDTKDAKGGGHKGEQPFGHGNTGTRRDYTGNVDAACQASSSPHSLRKNRYSLADDRPRNHAQLRYTGLRRFCESLGYWYHYSVGIRSKSLEAEAAIRGKSPPMVS